MTPFVLLCLLATSTVGDEDVHSRVARFGALGYSVTSPIQQQILVPVVGPNMVPGVGPNMIPGVGPNVVPGVGPNVVPGLGPNVVPVVGTNMVPGVGPNTVPVARPNVVSVVGPRGVLIAGPTAPVPSYPVVVDGSQLHEESCRYWCLTPEKFAYCCEESYEPESFVGLDKSGFCPAVRQNCPQTGPRSAPPRKCSNDHSCLGLEKCCFDRCLDRHVCKPLRGPYPGASPRVSSKAGGVPLENLMD